MIKYGNAFESVIYYDTERLYVRSEALPNQIIRGNDTPFKSEIFSGA